MFGGTLPGINWIACSWSWIGGSPLGVSNTLEWLSKTLWRSREIDDFDVGTSSEHNCAITPRCYFFRSFVRTLDLTIFPGFLVIPHNFIHCKVAKELNCFLYPAPECQVMVANGGTINFHSKCHNIKLTMGEYLLNSPILSIPMGGADVVLGVQWLQSLGTVAFNFQELFLNFFSKGKERKLNHGVSQGSQEI